MTAALGKRKRTAVKEKEERDDDAADLHALLQRHFESRFKPLETAPLRKPTDSDDESDDGEDDDTLSDPSEDEWLGVSDSGDDETPTVQVVDHTTQSTSTTTAMSKKELKAYLSSKPPSASSTKNVPAKILKATSDPEDSAAFLANDLALQRLIAESHILSAAGGNASHYLSSAAAETATNTRAFASGRIARKTTDLRIQALGAKESVLAQAKMPMSMRKGITRAAGSKEEKRRREARENGIVLEREAKKAVKRKKGGERPVDLPAVGKMRGAELRISAREIRAIENEGRRRETGRRKRRR
ncbi:hypothetical protein OQA88_435 [Cercophora sp. LCS_1]